MLDQNDLQAIATLIRNEVEPISKRLDKVDEKLVKVDERLDKVEKNIIAMKRDIKVIKQDAEITRVTANELVKWVDYNFHDTMPFPVHDEFDEVLESI